MTFHENSHKARGIVTHPILLIHIHIILTYHCALFSVATSELLQYMNDTNKIKTNQPYLRAATLSSTGDFGFECLSGL